MLIEDQALQDGSRVVGTQIADDCSSLKQKGQFIEVDL